MVSSGGHGGALRWLRELSRNLGVGFVAGVAAVYGFGHGFGESYLRVVSDYYWKDVRRVQPSSLQLYVGLCYVPLLMKPIWGVLTDSFPVSGYHRRPYLALSGILGILPVLFLSSSSLLPEALAVACFVSINAGIAIAGVTMDACIARNSIEHPLLTRDMQTLCMFCVSAGALLGYSSSGVVTHSLGPQVALTLLYLPPSLLFVLAFFIREPGFHHIQLSRHRPVFQRMAEAAESVSKAMRAPQVWKPSLFVYLSMALSISTHEGMFYWYTDPNVGPAFSQEFVGMIYAVGALGSIVGVLIFHRFLKGWTFRKLLFSAQLLYGASGMLDLAFLLRWNLRIGVPDYLFVALEESCSRVVFKLGLIAVNVLCMRLALPGAEGTFAAILKSVQSLGSLSSKWGGGVALSVFSVTRTDLGNLFWVLLARNLLRFATLGFVFLVPDSGQADVLLPREGEEGAPLELNEREEEEEEDEEEEEMKNML